MDNNDIIEGGRVLSVGTSHLLVDVDGVEVFVATRVKPSGCCDCCADIPELHVSYNRPEEDRIEKHGEADPLGIE